MPCRRIQHDITIDGVADPFRYIIDSCQVADGSWKLLLALRAPVHAAFTAVRHIVRRPDREIGGIAASRFLNRINRHWWKISDADLPWDPARASLYEFLCSQHLSDDADSDVELPDADRVRAMGGFWGVGGAMDSFSLIPDKIQQKDIAKNLLAALKKLSKRPTKVNARIFYDLIIKNQTAGYADSFTELLWGKGLDLLFPVLRKFEKIAVWLATRSPDRECAGKLGIALLGSFTGSVLSRKAGAPREILLTFARHEEFTLFAVSGLCHSVRKPDRILWDLAKGLHGWGRIHAVARLERTGRREIKNWLLRQGYRNSVMHQYLALICARGGDLCGALGEETPDAELLDAARDLIEALFRIPGGCLASKAIATVQLCFSSILKRARIDRRSDLSRSSWHMTFVRFVSNEKVEWNSLARWGWTTVVRREIQDSAEAVISRPVWREMVLRDLESDDEGIFELAARGF